MPQGDAGVSLIRNELLSCLVKLVALPGCGKSSIAKCVVEGMYLRYDMSPFYYSRDGKLRHRRKDASLGAGCGA